MSRGKPIPISVAERIAKEYGYDQVIVVARLCSTETTSGCEHVTTYGVTKEHCNVAAHIGRYLKTVIMKWSAER